MGQEKEEKFVEGHHLDAALHIQDDGAFDFEKTIRLELKKPVLFAPSLRSTIFDCLCRRDEANIIPRSLGIVFSNLSVVGVTAANSYLPTLGSILNPLGLLEKIQKIRHPSLRTILSGFHGVIKPGEMIRTLATLY